MDIETSNNRYQFILERAKHPVKLNKIVKTYGDNDFNKAVSYFQELMDTEVARENFEGCVSLREILAELERNKDLFLI